MSEKRGIFIADMRKSGNVYHRLEFETNNENTVANNLFIRLNTEDYIYYEYIQLSDLNINEKYKIVTFKIITTKYGDQVSVILNNKYKLLLPHRFINSISKQDIDTYNGKMCMIYKGKKNLDNGKSVNLIEFE